MIIIDEENEFLPSPTTFFYYLALRNPHLTQQGRNQCVSKRDVQQIHTVQFILCEVKSISNDLNEIII